jgi:Gamma-glutamyl cyclotransferase, AIG2-like
MSFSSTDADTFYTGTLMSTELLNLVLWGSANATPRLYREQISFRDAFLYKFRVRRVRARDYAGIIADPSSYVRGLLLGSLRDGDIENLDLYAGSQFERRKVKIKHYNLETSQDDMSGSGPSTADMRAPVANWVDTETYVWKDRVTLGNDS